MGSQGRLGPPAQLLALLGVIQEMPDGLGQGGGVADHDPGAGLFQDTLSPEEVLQVRAVDGHPAPGRGLQDVLAAVGHQGPAHKGDVGGAVQGEEVADGVDDHHRMRCGVPGRP